MAVPRPSEPSGLPEILAAEIALLGQFVDLLKLEQTALAAGDTTPLADYAARKTALGGALQDIAARRNGLLGAAGLGTDRAGVENWLARQPAASAAAADWARIIAQAGEAKELNRLNGKLIQMRIQANSAALALLQSGSGSLDLYGPDGQTQTSGDRRISDSA